MASIRIAALAIAATLSRPLSIGFSRLPTPLRVAVRSAVRRLRLIALRPSSYLEIELSAGQGDVFQA